MNREIATRELLESLEDTLDLLDEYGISADEAFVPDEGTLEGLLAQCATLAARAPDDEPTRSIHHMACTGGTVICKAISTMANVTLLSEIDPLSTLGLPALRATPQFRPSDIIYSGRLAARPIDDAVVERVAVAALEALRSCLAERGRILCVRDHAHSQYCTRADPKGRKTFNTLLGEAGPVRSIVTVRHPLDSFLSLQKNGWVHFNPDTLEEYAKRYVLFLDDHAALPVFFYEDFVDAPELELQRMCEALAISYEDGAAELLSAVRLSGDSGRSSSRSIQARPRREVPDGLQSQLSESPAYLSLCERLAYDPQ